MAVILRLARHGQKKRPFYRIVAASKQARRDGRFIEIVGNYNPLVNPPSISLKEDRIRYWIGVGAKTSTSVETIIKKHIPKLLEEKEIQKRQKILAARKARKARAMKEGKSPVKRASKTAKTSMPRTATKAKRD